MLITRARAAAESTTYGPTGRIFGSGQLDAATDYWAEHGGYLLLLADGLFVADGRPTNATATWSGGEAVEIVPDDGAAWPMPRCAAERITLSEARERLEEGTS